MSTDVILAEAIKAAASEYPSSVLADLLVMFPPKLVVKFIIAYSGQKIRVPKMEDIWRAYRNATIVEVLSAKDTRVVRQRLADSFNITQEHLRVIYSDERKKRRVMSEKAIRRTATTVYDTQFTEFVEQVKAALGR